MRRRLIGLLLVLAAFLGLAGTQTAQAAYVTTDYQWSSYVTASFLGGGSTSVRWRIDFQHVNGQRSGRAITYVDWKGPTTIHEIVVEELWHSSHTRVSSGSIVGWFPNSTTGDKYVGQPMSWVSMASVVDVSITAYLSDGRAVNVTHPY
jgi:hypothetical protein